MKIALCLVWLLAVGTGFAVILNYQNADGSAGAAPQHWPAQTSVALDAHHDTLLMFVHPQCPCTRASIEELNRLLAKTHGRAATRVLFVRPHGSADDWTKTDLWRSVAAIPGISVKEDPDGAQARLFGAATSGYVLLYDTHGQLLFSGGITASRGHVGDNAGKNAVYSLLTGQHTDLKQTRVFGCSLLGNCDALSPERSK